MEHSNDPADAPVVSLLGAGKTYRRSHLGRNYYSRGIEGVDLEIFPGETFGLLGLNGSGKTTTFKLILGLIAPTAGAVAVFSAPPGQAGGYSRIGYLPELPYFPSYLTPEESLAFYGRLSGMPRARLAEEIPRALSLTGLLPARRRRIKELSKGMVQRLGLAQAILHDPDLLILDEPASGLDPLAIKEMRDLLARLNEQGKTLLISSHSISEVERLCRRAAILKEGRLARVLEQKEWKSAPGGLEEIFVSAIR